MFRSQMDMDIFRRDLPVGIDVQNGEEKRPIFYGHLTAGSAFILAGIFWMARFSMNLNRKSDNKCKRNGTTVRLIPWEGIYWLSVGSFALIQILRVPFFRLKLTEDDGEFSVDSLQGWQHLALGLPFAVHGATRILSASSLFSLKLEDCVDPTGILACGMFSLITFLHTYARDPLDAHIHYIHAMTALSTTLFYAAEYFSLKDINKTKFFFPKALSMLLQGSWMFQAGFILDPPNGVRWQRDNFVNIMFISTTFVGHIFADIVILIIVYLCGKLASRIQPRSLSKPSKDFEQDTVPFID